jgi:hypothetical protein
MLEGNMRCLTFMYSAMYSARTATKIVLTGLAAGVVIGCATSGDIGQSHVRGAVDSGAVSVSVPSEVVAPGWERSYRAGSRDSGGRLAGGSEILHLVGHKGKLYAAAGYRMDPRNIMHGGASRDTGWGQILRLDRPDGRWEVDLEMIWHLRPEILQSVTFTTDGKGTPLSEPVNLLMASTYESSRYLGISLFTRDDATGTWEKSKIISGDTGERGEASSVRAMRVYRDKVTGVDRLFISIGVLGVFSGFYDPYAAGKIRWDVVSESGPVATRPLAIIEANGALLFSADKFIYRRIDGARPSYTVAHDLGDLLTGNVYTSVGGIRGMTAIANPQGAGQSLIFVWAPGNLSKACIFRLDPDGKNGYRRVQETCLDGVITQYLGGTPVRFVLAGYNNLLPVVDPATREVVHLIGLEAWINSQRHPTAQRKTADRGFYAGALFAIRNHNGGYRLGEVNGRIIQSNPPLVATRAYALSPFAGDDANVVYFGGYDCNSVRSPDTAWIFRTTVTNALRRDASE